jgi:hypothetical protein
LIPKRRRSNERRALGKTINQCSNILLWVRRSDGKYKCTQVGGCSTIKLAAALAGMISREAEFWMDAAEAAKEGWPLYGPDQELAADNTPQVRGGCP